MAPYKSLPYRPCVGLMVINRKGRVFIGRRANGPEHVDAKHAWQMPQGGVDEGEDTYAAALRELYEETSIRSVERLGAIRAWLATTSHARSSARRGRANTAARSRSGTRCVSPARTPKSTSSIPAAAISRSS